METVRLVVSIKDVVARIELRFHLVARHANTQIELFIIVSPSAVVGSR